MENQTQPINGNVDRKTPLVSIITPVYNAGQWLPALFSGVAQQIFTEYEHVLVNDCSTDQSERLLREYSQKDARVKVVSLERNSGPIFARNKAIECAQGRYLSFLDADDFWLPEKLEAQVNFMKKHQPSMSYHDYRQISADGSLLGKIIRGPDQLTWSKHHWRRGIGCLTVMIDRRQIPDFKFPSIGAARRGEDFLAWANIVKHGKTALRLPKDLARYRLTPASRSEKKLRGAASVWKIYREMEKIPLLQAGLYFSGYALHSTWLRYYAKPRRPRSEVDGF